jgi:hypothetical protein
MVFSIVLQLITMGLSTIGTFTIVKNLSVYEYGEYGYVNAFVAGMVILGSLNAPELINKYFKVFLLNNTKLYIKITMVGVVMSVFSLGILHASNYMVINNEDVKKYIFFIILSNPIISVCLRILMFNSNYIAYQLLNLLYLNSWIILYILNDTLSLEKLFMYKSIANFTTLFCGILWMVYINHLQNSRGLVEQITNIGVKYEDIIIQTFKNFPLAVCGYILPFYFIWLIGFSVGKEMLGNYLFSVIPANLLATLITGVVLLRVIPKIDSANSRKMISLLISNNLIPVTASASVFLYAFGDLVISLIGNQAYDGLELLMLLGLLNIFPLILFQLARHVSLITNTSLKFSASFISISIPIIGVQFICIKNSGLEIALLINFLFFGGYFIVITNTLEDIIKRFDIIKFLSYLLCLTLGIFIIDNFYIKNYVSLTIYLLFVILLYFQFYKKQLNDLIANQG